MGVYRAVTWKGRVGILTGGGNNGGDGYALAAILADQGIALPNLSGLGKVF